MKTAYDLLMSAPDDQVTRCKIVMRAIIACPYRDKRKLDGRLTWSRAFATAWCEGFHAAASDVISQP